MTEETCPTESDLLAFASASLPESSVLTVASHLDRCEECLDLVVALSRQQRDSAQTARRYSIQAPLAQGGMGVILAATDEALDRSVVLKTARSLDTAARLRFEREIRVTARLQHPSIVPVYDGGVLEDGTPFYAMRRVDGQELEACIQGASTPAERLSLLRPYTDLVEAMAYAHAEGFIHRDLKPRNVLVGQFGETVVVDWGLAKSIRTTTSEAEATEVAGLEAAGSETETGIVMGTRGYVAPELRRGEDASTRSDVFSLGIILRRILTGERAPNIKAQDLRALRVSKAPADLEAIVRRATMLDPRARYANAGALADDLHRFEAGRLVDARAYSRSDRVLRFVNRNRPAVGIALLSTVLLVGTTTWTLLKVDAARDKAERALASTQVAEHRATKEREAAEALIDFALLDLSEELRAAGRSAGLERLANEVDGYYTNRGPAARGPRNLRQARAVAIEAGVAERRGENDAAMARWRDVLNLLPSEPDADTGLGSAFRLRTSAESSLALLLAERGELDEAVETARTAITQAQTQTQHSRQSPGSILGLSVARSRLMVVLEYAGRQAEAAAVAEELLATLALLPPDPEHTLMDELRVRAEGMLGRRALAQQDGNAATTHLRRAVEGAEALQRKRPNTVVSLELAATHRFELAQHLASSGALEDAQPHLLEVIGDLELLCALQPDAVSSVLRLSNARTTLASIHLERGTPQPAAELLRDDRRDLLQLLDRQPGLDSATELLGFTEVSLGRALAKSGNASGARVAFAQGLDRLERLAGPQSAPGSRARLAYAQLVAGAFHAGLSEYDDAIRLLASAREIRIALIGEQQDPVQKLGVAEVTVQLADVQWAAGNRSEARALVEDALQAVSQAKAAGVPQEVWMVVVEQCRELAAKTGTRLPGSETR